MWVWVYRHFARKALPRLLLLLLYSLPLFVLTLIYLWAGWSWR